MQCPYCAHAELKVVDKRDTENNIATRRRRECLHCNKRFTTYERIETDLRVVKKDGRREKFDREKLHKGLTKACEKRPVNHEQITNTLNKIEAHLRDLNTVDIKSNIVGELIMKELRKLDKVAYIRFASVYRDFRDIEDFGDEIKKLVKR